MTTSPSRFTLYALNEGSPPVADAWAWGLAQLGHAVHPPQEQAAPGEIHLFFGLPDVPRQALLADAPRAIHVNLEQIAGRNARLETRAGSFALMRHIPNWDGSRFNMEVLQAGGITDICHVPMGWAPVLERIPARAKDLDIVCPHFVDARGAALLMSLKARGLKVEWCKAGRWSPQEMDEHIARARLVLVLARYEDVHVFDEVRVGYLLANRAAVVAEVRPGTLIEDDMRQCVAGAPLEELGALCVRLAGDEAARQELSGRGYDIFRQREWLPQLERAVAQYVARNPEVSNARRDDVPPPRRLNIGSGKSWKHDHFNIDIDPTRGADLVFDLSQPFAHDAEHDSWRFGKIRLPRGHFEYILAEHVFEHVQGLIQCVTTCIDWLAEGGTLEVEVPYDLSYGAWQDPTHIRAFNERSWLYYTDWCWYVGWREHRFDLVSNVFQYSDSGRQLLARGVDPGDIARTPRAVDTLRATFRKRALTDEEKEAHSGYFRTVS